jgi:hypothetical protein
MYETLARRATADRRPCWPQPSNGWALADRAMPRARSMASAGADTREPLAAHPAGRPGACNGQTQQAWQALSGIAALAALASYYRCAHAHRTGNGTTGRASREIAAEQSLTDAAALFTHATADAAARSARSRRQLRHRQSGFNVVRGWLDLGAISATRGVSLTGGAEALAGALSGHRLRLLTQALPAALTGSGTVTHRVVVACCRAQP